MRQSRSAVCVLTLIIAMVQLVAADAGKKKQTVPPLLAKASVFRGGELPTGTYTVGSGGYFPTLDSAFRRLRGSGIAGAVTLSLIDTLYIAPAADSGSFSLNGPINGSDSTHRITIRPAWNNAVTLRGNGAAVLMFHNVSFVTIDGQALEGPTRLRVHAQTDLARAWNDGIDFAGDCDHVEVLNLQIHSDNVVRESDGVGMWAEESGGPDHCVVSGVKISSAFFGIYISASLNGNNRPQGIILRNNQIGGPADSLMAIGIQTVETDGIIIEGNHIQKLRNVMSGPSRYYQFGINAYNSRSASIRNNTVHDLSASYPNTAIEGILSSGDTGLRGSNIWIYNNVIFDVKNQAGAGNTSAIAGIRVWRNDDVYLYHNSILLSSANDSAPGLGSAAVCIDATVIHPVIQNNIAVNVRTASGETAVSLRIDIVGGVADYNALHVAPRPGAILARRASELHAGLAEWRGTGNDHHSSDLMPAFLDPLLHIDNSSAQNGPLDAHGTPVPGITTDFDGKVRSTLAPDLGAYEFDMPVPTRFGRLWTKIPANAVLGGVPGSWFIHAFNPCVIFNPDSARFEMWFNGTNSTYATDLPGRIGYATSRDGIAWTLYPTPVLSPTLDTWDAKTVETPRVIREQGTYKMWYSSYASGTSPSYFGYATSPDGIQWTKYPANPVFGPGSASWEAGGPYAPFVMPVDGGYHMWYDALNAEYKRGSIGFATSSDGVHWIRDSLHNPIITPGATDSWDDNFTGYPVVLRLTIEDSSDAYFLWYVGSRTDGHYRSGLAVSRDGVSGWVKGPTNPVLTASSGGWDGGHAGICSVIRQGSLLHAWYDGSNDPVSSNRLSIGHAISPISDVRFERTHELPAAFVLEHNYPNPFNPSTTIRFSLTRSGATELTVYDLLGRVVTTLVNESLVPGRYTVRWDAEGIASGIYFYRLRSEEFTETKRMLLLK